MEISADITNFLFILFVGIIGFGVSFYALSNNNDNVDDRFINGIFDSFLYSYKLVLGEFDLDKFEKSTNKILLWVLFIICSLFTMIILLNMLIAIMGDSFNRVNEESENQRVREHL